MSEDAKRFLAPGWDFGTVTDKISSIILGPTPLSWFVGFGAAFAALLLFIFAVSATFLRGIGLWGVGIPVAWGFAIVNFVWWIGIGHAGTLISAILLLLHQKWRTSINRFAEAMTLFAVACAGTFPLLHLGRPQFFYWLFPYPDTMGLWPQFRSPLVWDVFAVSTYFTVSLLFWYTGLIPDLATLRDTAKSKLARVVYGVMAFGWRGSARHWRRFETAYLLLAGLATPLVVSVHSVVSFDFSVAILPGWHSPIFPPYFVAGAIYSGFCMVLTLAIPLRSLYGLHDFITDDHLELCAKLMLATGLIVDYGYVMEFFMAYYSGDIYEKFLAYNRAMGPCGWSFWLLFALNMVLLQALWSRRVRRSVPTLFVLSLLLNFAMWIERYVIVVVSLTRDFLPSSWGYYGATRFDWSLLLGSFGLFLTCFFLFVRFLPAISMSEMRGLIDERQEAGK